MSLTAKTQQSDLHVVYLVLVTSTILAWIIIYKVYMFTLVNVHDYNVYLLVVYHQISDFPEYLESSYHYKI